MGGGESLGSQPVLSGALAGPPYTLQIPILPVSKPRVQGWLVSQSGGLPAGPRLRGRDKSRPLVLEGEGT